MSLSRTLAAAACALVLGCGAPRPNTAASEAGKGTITAAPRVDRSRAAAELEAALSSQDWLSALVAASAVGPQARDEAVLAVDRASADVLRQALERITAGEFPAELITERLGKIEAHVDGYKGAKTASSAETSHIAVLLPLTGPYDSLGREARAAVQIAAAEIGSVEWTFYDTEGDAQVARARVSEAAANGAIAFLGPIGDTESLAAAERAVELGLPIGLLGPGYDEPARGVFRLVSSPVAEARAAAKMAKILGYQRVAVFAPRDEHGERAASAFVTLGRALGLTVLADERYDPTATDLETDLKRLLGLDPVKNRRYARHLRRGGDDAWKTFSPNIPFDLLYIPDEYRRSSLVAAYLPFFNVEVRTRSLMNTYGLRRKHGGRLPSVVQLMGSSSWHNLALIPAGGRTFEGALVLANFVGGADEDFVYSEAAVFAEAFARRQRRPPSALAAQIYDAARLVGGVAVDAAGDPRKLEQRFARATVEGACGPARIGPTRTLVRQPVVLQIQRGEFAVYEY